MALYGLTHHTLLSCMHVCMRLSQVICSLPHTQYTDSVALHELASKKISCSASVAACCLRVQPAECARTWPGFAGSRSGALIATAWASMLHLGNAGFLRITAQIMQARPCLGTFA